MVCGPDGGELVVFFADGVVGGGWLCVGGADVVWVTEVGVLPGVATLPGVGVGEERARPADGFFVGFLVGCFVGFFVAVAGGVVLATECVAAAALVVTGARDGDGPDSGLAGPPGTSARIVAPAAMMTAAAAALIGQRHLRSGLTLVDGGWTGPA
jgi:hypothetical protein